MTKIILTKEGVFYTLQGEGRFTGVPSVFVRLSTCNLRCRWTESDGQFSTCDTPHSSYRPDRDIRYVDDVIADMSAFPSDAHWVITGGEPLLQMPAVNLIVSSCPTFCTIETNGTIKFDASLLKRNVTMSISPKLSSAHAAQIQIEQCVESTRDLIACHDNYQLKFVVNHRQDVHEILQFIEQTNADKLKVILMPQGNTMEKLANRQLMVVDLCKELGFRFSARLHIDLWSGRIGT